MNKDYIYLIDYLLQLLKVECFQHNAMLIISIQMCRVRSPHIRFRLNIHLISPEVCKFSLVMPLSFSNQL